WALLWLTGGWARVAASRRDVWHPELGHSAPLLRYLAEPDADPLALEAVLTIAANRPIDGAVGAVVVLARHREPRVRRAAVNALGAIHDVSAVPTLLDMLRDPESDIREAAAQTLGGIGDASAVPALLGTLQTPESGVRAYAVQALGRIGDASAIPMLLE